MPLTADTWEVADDLDLLRAADDELAAFEELVRRHQDFVFGLVLRVVRDRSQAEDLAQEAMLRMYRSRHRFRGDSAVRTWLYRIATNLAINAVTRRREYPTESLPDVATAASGPEDEAATEQLRLRLVDAIASLSDDLRVPLVLRTTQELSYQEIAATTGVPLNTVRTRILRARNALRKELVAWR